MAQKQFHRLSDDTARKLVQQLNDKGISKDDIVCTFEENGQHVIIYYA